MMKKCKYCSVERHEQEFEVCRVVKGKAYRRLKCQKCKQASNNQRRAKLREWIIQYKKTLACSRCGFSDYRALEFHHDDRDDKALNVADLVSNVSSLATVKREIEKCIVLCSNCHRIEHYQEGWQALYQTVVDRAFTEAPRSAP